MSILKTTEEIKLHLSNVDTDFKIASLQSFIDDAEQNILIPWLGFDFFDTIETAYNANSLSVIQRPVHKLMQKAVTHLAFMLSTDSGTFRISDSGFYVISTDRNKPVSDKKMSMFYAGRREAGYRALEQATIYLERNIDEADFSDYKDSDERLAHASHFINTSVEFTRYYTKVNNSAYFFNQLSDALDRAERKYIAPVLGQTYYASLKERLPAGLLTDPEKMLLIPIRRAMANLTIAEGITNLPIQFEGSNLVINSQPAYGNSENVESKSAASVQQLSMLAGAAMITGQSELRSLADYIVDNASSLPGFILREDTGDIDINTPDSPTYFV